MTYDLPKAKGPTANTAGFVYVIDFNTCSVRSSQVYNLFNNKGIRSIKFGEGLLPTLAMLAYDNAGS